MIVVAVIGAFGTILAAIVGKDVRSVKKQLIPNGGASARDSLDRIERNVTGLSHRVDTLGMRLEEHLTEVGDTSSGL